MFEDEELEACQTQEELGKTLEVTQQAISKRLKTAGYIRKEPHELKTRDVERRFIYIHIWRDTRISSYA